MSIQKDSLYREKAMNRNRDMESARSVGRVPAAFLFLFLVSFSPLLSRANEQTMITSLQSTGKIRAPELDGGVAWLNVEKPIRLADLRGKIVLLDFWTYCCINCMHVIPDLKRLESRYPNELVVIGVHSAKFINERESENILSAVLRYEIEHPVVNDAEFKIWRAYGARGWPHLVLIDPDGYLYGAVSGEGNYEILDRSIQQLIRQFEGKLNRTPIALSLEKTKQPPSLLSFPGKILADEKSNRLFIADSNHNRIVIADLQGKVTGVAGTGMIGNKDGAFTDAQFFRPQGMALSENSLFVADTENHTIRKLDLVQGTVETIAGTGKQSVGLSAGGLALRTALNSPWDLEILNDGPQIYIAMAGPHQLWIYDPTRKTVAPYAGTGREDIIDGTLRTAALAQPSGLTGDGQNLYFADSEVSALRWVDRSTSIGRVKTLIGTGLFDFGDRDGEWKQALLQHPLGVCYRDKKIYVADSYNHKIKIADLQSQTIETVAGNGKSGLGTPNAPQFNEPGGVSLAGNLLFVADTNNHAIRTIDLQSKSTKTLQLDFSEWELTNGQAQWDIASNPSMVSLPEKGFTMEGSVQISFEFPEGYHLNPIARPIVQQKVYLADREWIGHKFHPDMQGDAIRFNIQKGTFDHLERIEIAVTFYYCRTDNQGECRIGFLLLQGKLRPGNELIHITYSVR